MSKYAVSYTSLFKKQRQRDCHIRPDWLLIYEKHDNTLTLLLCETGTHSDLFGR